METGLLRALSTTKGRRGGYDRLLDETNDVSSVGNNQDNAVLKRTTSVPARSLFGLSSRKITSSSSSSFSLFRSFSRKVKSSSSSPETSIIVNNNTCNNNSSSNNNKSNGQPEKKTCGKVHPVFGLFDGRSWSKRKFTANPDFSRYVEYVKEGGVKNKDLVQL